MNTKSKVSQIGIGDKISFTFKTPTSLDTMSGSVTGTGLDDEGLLLLLNVPGLSKDIYVRWEAPCQEFVYDSIFND